MNDLNPQEKADLVQKKLDLSITYLTDRLNHNKMWAGLIKITSVLFSALITVLLGFQISGFDGILKNTAFVLGAIVTLLNALEPFFNYRALWVESEVALAGLQSLRDDVHFYLAGRDPVNLEVDTLHCFLERYKTIWNSYNQNIIRHRKSNHS
jgi:hypothetical protein